MKTRLFSIIGLVAAVSMILLSTSAPLAQAERENPVSVNPAPLADVRAVMNQKIYLPLVMKSCGSTGETYGTINMIPPVADHPDYLHADLNIDLRGYQTTSNTPLGLKAITGATDANAPQLKSLFSPNRVPTFVQNYQVGNWDWCGSGGACPDGSNPGTFTTNPPVTLSGFSVSTSEKIYVPTSGYQIGASPVYNVAVLYATSKQITFIYTAQDTVASGYAIHIDKICVDPSLLGLYQSMNSAGRDYLPALRHGQAIGYPLGSEIVVSIVDRGAFQDPRSCKDWWKSNWNGSTSSPVCF